jgi:hypothetical protein
LDVLEAGAVPELAAALVAVALGLPEVAELLLEDGGEYLDGSSFPQFACSAWSHAFCAFALPALLVLHSV